MKILSKISTGLCSGTKRCFYKKSLAQQFNAELLQKAGLVVVRNDQLVDNYRDRIIFPVHNNRERLLALVQGL